MAISLKVLAPNKNVYQGEAEEVILPSTTGQIGVLPGHISLVTAIDIGVLRLRMNSQWKSIALMGGFAEICLLYTSPSPRDFEASRMPSSA